MEESALACILKTECEKVQRFLGLEHLNPSQILEINESMIATVSAVSSLEMILKEKLEFVYCGLCCHDCSVCRHRREHDELCRDDEDEKDDHCEEDYEA